MTIDYTKAHIILADKSEWQVLDENGEFDGEATKALIEEYLATKGVK